MVYRGAVVFGGWEARRGGIRDYPKYEVQGVPLRTSSSAFSCTLGTGDDMVMTASPRLKPGPADIWAAVPQISPVRKEYARVRRVYA